MLNKVMIIGRLGADPEIRNTQSGIPVVSLRIATDESYTDRNGNRTERTEWHRVVVFQRQAETCGQYLHKGSLVYVEGKITTRKWQDQNGQDRYSTEIRADRVIFLDRKNADVLNEQGGRQSAAPGNEYGGEDMEPAFTSRAYDGRQRQSRPQQNPMASKESYPETFPGQDQGGMDDVPF